MPTRGLGTGNIVGVRGIMSHDTPTPEKGLHIASYALRIGVSVMEL